jgi:hypothetical protein
VHINNLLPRSYITCQVLKMAVITTLFWLNKHAYLIVSNNALSLIQFSKHEQLAANFKCKLAVRESSIDVAAAMGAPGSQAAQSF